MSESFDVVFIGGGPGGYTAAIRAAQLGLKTACIERRPTLGGTCLNIGCIPSKALLHSSQCYEQALHHLDEHGILVSSVALDLAKMQARKARLVESNAKGIEFLFRRNKVAHVQGTARFTGPNSLAVTARDGKEQIVESRAIVIATGSDVASLPGVTIDEKIVVSSTGALEFSKVPGHLIVIGGGAIGLELGTVWRRLGAKVTVVEFLDRLCPSMDAELTSLLHRLLARQGMAFHLESKVIGVERQGDGAVLTFEPAAGGAPTSLACDAVLVAIGRKPYTQGLGLDAVGVAVDRRGCIVTDGHFRTNIPSIFAIGDVIDGPMLAHKAEEEGVAVAELLAGQAGHVNYGVIPSVIYTAPEVASVGMSEEQAKAAGIAYKAGKFPFTANGRARAMGDTDGFVKILADAGNDRVLGVHIIGPEASTLIAEAAVAMEFGAASEDIARTCHAHPTLSEALKEAALAVEGRSRNI